jgi:hypothetical protein
VTADAPAPPAPGVKVNVAFTAVLLATRSSVAMPNVTFETAPPIAPQDTAGLEAAGSLSVCTVTESVAALATPMVQPTSVTVTVVPAAKAVPATVNTIEVAPGGPGVMEVPCADTLAVGVGDVAKKPDG